MHAQLYFHICEIELWYWLCRFASGVYCEPYGKWCSINWMRRTVHTKHTQTIESSVEKREWSEWGKPKHWIWRRQNLNLIYVCKIGKWFYFSVSASSVSVCGMRLMAGCWTPHVLRAAHIPWHSNMIFIVNYYLSILFCIQIEIEFMRMWNVVVRRN